MNRITDLETLEAVRAAGLAKLLPARPRIAVGMGTCGAGNGAAEVYRALAAGIDRRGLDVSLVGTGCFGFCAEEPLVNVWVPGRPLVILRRITTEHVDWILDNVAGGEAPQVMALCKIEDWDFLTAKVHFGDGYPNLPTWDEVPFFANQKKIVLRDCGLIDPDDIEEYVGIGGFRVLYDALAGENPAKLLDEIKASKLRGRGGAGFSTGRKWEFLRNAAGTPKYLICNADEGDPGAYMNRNEIEGDPFALIEGMLIAGYITGASQGIVYARAEYPLAVRRLKAAIATVRECGLLGTDIFGKGFSFDLNLVEGAGAFVCGEETALIASIEGKPGRPTSRPPFPAQKGLWGKPTNINNVETWFNVVPILAKGAAWFTETGSEKSAGTKVFSLVGRVKNTGLVEMPLGTPLGTFVYATGACHELPREVKAVQTGGPSGGCIPRALFDTPVDYESLAKVGSIMGSGGMVVMDETNCMVDFARYFIEFTRSESCGKCTPCRVGLDKALHILTRITRGEGRAEDIPLLEELSRTISQTSLCSLGQSAPNPVMTALRYFRAEFEDHIYARRCKAGACAALALSPCENGCRLHMNIPRFLQLYNEGRLEDAFLSVIMDNPLPASTGRVCQHPCNSRCRRGQIDESVAMREVHRVIADEIMLTSRFGAMVERIVARKLKPSGKKVGIVGAGPAGLTAAFYLAMLGHEVTIYDNHNEPGGMLRYAFPAYRLPRNVLNKEIELIRRLGVDFELGTMLGKTITFDDLESRYDAVFLALGTWKDVDIQLEGAEFKGVLPSLAFLEAHALGRAPAIGRKVVVVGGGNSAIDAARSALRMGAEATVVYRRERRYMPAILEEIEAAEAEGVNFVYLSAPKRVIGEEGIVTGLEINRMVPGEFGLDGRRWPIPSGKTETIACDSVILATGEEVDGDFGRTSGMVVDDYGVLKVDRYSFRTSRDKFFAGGDLVTGPSEVSGAMGQGKQAARAIDRRLSGADRFPAIMPVIEFGHRLPTELGEPHRRHPHELNVEERLRSEREVMLALSPEEAREEARRCLRCDIRDECDMAAAE